MSHDGNEAHILKRVFKNVHTRVCFYCGKVITNPNDLTVDHVFPKDKGGKDEWDNYAIACKTCNSEKCTFLEDEFVLYLEYKKSFKVHTYEQLQEVMLHLNSKFSSRHILSNDEKVLLKLQCLACKKVLNEFLHIANCQYCGEEYGIKKRKKKWRLCNSCYIECSNIGRNNFDVYWKYKNEFRCFSISELEEELRETIFSQKQYFEFKAEADKNDIKLKIRALNRLLKEATG